MSIDPKTFFILVTTIAAGGVGGYVASEKQILGPKREPAPPPQPAPIATPMSAVVVTSAAPAAPAAPACDDSVGVAGDCPPLGLPTEEGGCGGYATARCNEFKQSLKPRVAANAVGCLSKLTPAERCDPKRVDLCGHNALQNACSDETSVTTACQSIVASSSCTKQTPSLVDCQRTMSGMTAMGRELMATCMKKHCDDKGLFYCEAVSKGL